MLTPMIWAAAIQIGACVMLSQKKPTRFPLNFYNVAARPF